MFEISRRNKGAIIRSHILIARLDQNLLDVLLKVHIPTGCDITSKIGTKSAALKSDPHMCLKKIGENELLESCFVDAELYLIKILQSNSPSTTFDELRYELYRKKNKTLYDRPPTSRSLQGHLEWCYYLINESLNLLSKVKSLEPTVCVWESFEAYLLPSKREVSSNISSYVDVVKDVKDDVIVLKMMFLALSFVNVQETVAIYKCAILMCNSFYFS